MAPHLPTLATFALLSAEASKFTTSLHSLPAQGRANTFPRYSPSLPLHHVTDDDFELPRQMFLQRAVFSEEEKQQQQQKLEEEGPVPGAASPPRDDDQGDLIEPEAAHHIVTLV